MAATLVANIITLLIHKDLSDEKNNQSHKTTCFTMTTLAMSLMLVSHSAFALQSLNDSDLRNVNGQDGVQIATTYDAVDVQQFYWEDDAGRGSNGATNTKLRAIAEGFKIRQSNASALALGTNYKINIGSDAGKSGLDLDLSSNPSLITVDAFKICDTEATARCSEPVGTLVFKQVLQSVLISKLEMVYLVKQVNLV
jgi:hypothetical protein